MVCRIAKCLLLSSLLLVAAGPSHAADSPVASERVVAAGELLQIEYLGLEEMVPLDAPSGLHEPRRPDGTVYVRVGDDGFARFPLTERRLPFAELELPVIEVMLTTHLHLNGEPEAKVSVTRPPQGGNLVTILGLVAKPGVYELPPTATLADAVAAAGGLVESEGEAVEPTPIDDTPSFPNFLPRSSEPTPAQKSARDVKKFRLTVLHPDYDLPAAGGSVITPGLILVEQSKWAELRLCIDGIILNVEEAPGKSHEPTADLFKPL